MEHDVFFHRTSKKISWTVKTGDKKIDEKRDHHDFYFDRVNDEQSKYIALHVGIFWGIGRFIIKNGDTVNIMLDSNSMYEHFCKNKIPVDVFIQKRTGFYDQLINQRKLKINYFQIEPKDNIAKIK